MEQQQPAPQKPLRVRMLGAQVLVFPFTQERSFVELREENLKHGFGFHAGTFANQRVHIIREVQVCSSASGKDCTFHATRIHDLLHFKQEDDQEEIIVLVIASGCQGSATIRTSKWTYEHALVVEVPRIRQVILTRPQTRSVLVVLTNNSKPPARVSAAEINQLADSIFAEGVVDVEDGAFDKKAVWERLLRTAFQDKKRPPLSPLIASLATNSVEEFNAALKSGVLGSPHVGFLGEKLPVLAYLPPFAAHAAEKFNLLLASNEAKKMSKLQFGEAVLAGTDPSLLLKWRGLEKAEDYDVCLLHPNRVEMIEHLLKIHLAGKVTFSNDVTNVLNTRLLSLQGPPVEGVNYAKLFLSNTDNSLYISSTRMSYLLKHRMFSEVKSIASSLSSKKLISWAPQQCALYRAMWMHLCKLKLKDRSQVPNEALYESLYDYFIIEFTLKDRQCTLQLMAGVWVLSLPTRTKAPSLASQHPLTLFFPSNLRPQFLVSYFQPLSLQDSASIAVLAHKKNFPTLLRVSAHTWSLLATPVVPYYCFMRVAPIAIQKRFLKYFDAMREAIPFNTGAAIEVHHATGYKSRCDYGKGDIIVKTEMTFNGHRVRVTMDDEGYLEVVYNTTFIFRLYKGTQLDSHYPQEIIAGMRLLGIPMEDTIPFLVVLYTWIRYGNSPMETLVPMRIDYHRLCDREHALPVPFWWINVRTLFAPK